MSEATTPVIELVTTKSDEEIAADLKARLQQAMKPVLALFDEAVAAGLLIRFDGIAPGPPYMKHQILNPTIHKVY